MAAFTLSASAPNILDNGRNANDKSNNLKTNLKNDQNVDIKNNENNEKFYKKCSVSIPDVTAENEKTLLYKKQAECDRPDKGLQGMRKRLLAEMDIDADTDANSDEVDLIARIVCDSPNVTNCNSNNRRTRFKEYNARISEAPGCRKWRRKAVFKNGDCNVMQINISERRRRYLQDLFTTLVDAQWRWTFLAFAMSFLLSWLAFAAIWWLIAFSHGDFLQENINNSSWLPCVTNTNGFIPCFLFSIETQHSTGYGYRYPTAECADAIFLLCIQTIIGVIIQAFMVGIVFAKMARPKLRKQTLLFSRHCVISQRDGQMCLLFRVGDMREKSHLINATIRVYLMQSRTTQEGEVLAPYLYELQVQIDGYKDNIILVWPMIVLHKIDIDSPLYRMNATDLLTERFEIIVILEGTTESTGQTTQARTSYMANEILWGHRFKPLIKYNKEKQVHEVDYDLFHHTYQVDTPLCSAEELHNILENELHIRDSQLLIP